MVFFLTSIEKDTGCASAVFVDGLPLSDAALQKTRREAQVEIFPCHRQCCLKYACKTEDAFHPLRLHIFLSLPSCFSFSLSRGDQILLTKKEPFFLSYPPRLLGQYAISCAVSLAKRDFFLYATLSAARGAQQRVRHLGFEGCDKNLSDLSVNIPLNWSFPNDNDGANGKFCSLLSRRDSFTSEDSGEVKSDNFRSKNVSFDDSEPIKGGLTRAYEWKGLTRTENISVCKLKFWVSADAIFGFQATYRVNGFQMIGPRRSKDAACHLHHRRIFELREGENLGCIQMFRNTTGFIFNLSVVTDKGRFISIGKTTRSVQSNPETLLRHPSARLVGFRGSFSQGRLAELGFVYELEESDQFDISRGYRCYVCGALCTYFRDMGVFHEHVSECVLQLVTK